MYGTLMDLLMIWGHDGRSRQPFGKDKNGHKNFRQVSTYYFRDKCVIANSQILLSIICKIYHVMVNFLPRKHRF